MKKSILSLISVILLGVLMSAKAQMVDQLYVIPSNITTDDDVSVVAHVMFPNSACHMIYYTIDDTSNIGHIKIYTYHEQGMMPAVCNSIDTIALGQLAPRKYLVEYYVSFTTPPTTPSDTVSFEVHVPTKLPFTKTRTQDLYLFPNPAKDNIQMALGEELKNATFVLFSALGKEVFRFENKGEKHLSVNIAEFTAGLYILKVFVKDNYYGSEKIIIK